jgi:hypothetical protein
VLAHVRPGRVARLELSREQKRALRDADGQLALDVLRHLLGARAAAAGDGTPSRFPLSEQAFQAIARRLGHEVGQKRARALTRRFVEEEVTESAGHYRQRHLDSAARSGFHVALPPRRHRGEGGGGSRQEKSSCRQAAICQEPLEAAFEAAQVGAHPVRGPFGTPSAKPHARGGEENEGNRRAPSEPGPGLCA